MFKTRKNKQSKIEVTNKKDDFINASEPYEIPKICGFDLTAENISKLQKANFHIYDGSLGKMVKIENQPCSGHCCLPNHRFPNNLHEYDIYLFDMAEREEIEYEIKDHTKNKITTEKDFYFYCSYPMNIFDPRANGGKVIKEAIQYHLDKTRLVVVFADSYKEVKYRIAEKGGRTTSVVHEETINNYSFMPYNIHATAFNNKTGKKIVVCDKWQLIISFLQKYVDEMEYHITFNHPTRWEGSVRVNDENFVPLLTNDTNEIISYVQLYNKVWTFVFPAMKDKNVFLLDLFTNILPDIIPTLFPNDEKHSWKNRIEYFLPNQEDLREEEKKLISRHEEEQLLLKEKMDDNNKTFSYLHSILTDTGDSLVINIIKYFTWLGFKDIRNMDEFLKDKKEEDIQIQLSNGLLIIEAKGIGGTSKDEECSQISKIRSRRCEERNTFDVIALYIVNHQRHIPPLERKNPPFSEDQIRDAVLNKRNLLTTWTLYNAHFDIINGFISKQRVIECLLKPGLVEFLPDRIVELNTVKEVFLNGEVIIIDLIENSLNSNDTLAYKDGFRFVLIRILSIQVNAQDVAKAENCEVGIKINSKIKKGTKIFKCVQAD